MCMRKVHSEEEGNIVGSGYSNSIPGTDTLGNEWTSVVVHRLLWANAEEEEYK